MKSIVSFLSTLLLATSLHAETATLWLTLSEAKIGPGVSWDGSARVSGGGSVAVREWLFEDTDKLDGASWQARTQHSKDTVKGGRNVRRSTLGKGLLLDVNAPLSATLTLSTKLGDISVPLADILKRRDMEFLDGRARLRHLPDVQSLTGGGDAEEEFPSIAVLPDGRMAVAYVAWDGKKDRVWLRVGDKAEPLTEAGDFLEPRVAANGRGELWCVWAANDGKQWDLWARTPGKSAFQLTRSPQNDFWPRLARDKNG
ncbi:MAG: hypothetical protein FJ388_19360, partial [Verrucomicrobia bacterium]|nr:hypothetical protein [Verrucomicrobiota bacterium]